MKIFKIILFIIFLVVLAVFGIQNQEYFLASTPLHIDFKISSLHYTVMEFPNWAYWVLCLVIGLLITGIRGLITAFRLKRQVRTRDERIESMKGKLILFRHALIYSFTILTSKNIWKKKPAKIKIRSRSQTEEKKKA